MKQGWVYLYYNGNLIRSRIYQSKKERNKVIESWRNLYRESFNKCIIAIQPNADERKVEEDGTNTPITKYLIKSKTTFG